MANYLKYKPELKERVLRLHFEKGRTKKGSSILCQGNRLVVYQFIHKTSIIFGPIWLLCKFNLYLNAYYNYLKNRKLAYHAQKG